MKNRRIIPMIVYLVLLIAVFSWASGLFTQSQDQIPYSDVLKLFQNQQVRSFVVDDNVITMELYEPYAGQTTVTATLADTDRFRSELDDLFVEQANSGVLESFHFRAGKSPSAYDLILPLLIVGLVLYLRVERTYRYDIRTLAAQLAYSAVGVGLSVNELQAIISIIVTIAGFIISVITSPVSVLIGIL